MRSVLINKVLPLAGCLGLLTGAAALAADNTAIEERLSDYRPGGILTVPADEALLTGDNDLVLLRYRKLFALDAEAGYTHTNNAFLSDNNQSSDHIIDASVTARFATRIAQKYDLFAAANILTSRYGDNEGLGYNGIGVQAGASMPVGNYHMGLVYGMTMAFDRAGFGDRQVTLHDVALSTNRSFILSANTAIVPQVVLGRTFADPEDYDVWSARAGVSLVHRFRPGLTGTIAVDGGYKHYDDYFESVTGEQRTDGSLRFSTGVRWELCEMVTLAGNLAFTSNRSSVNNNNYHAFTASPNVRVTARF